MMKSIELSEGVLFALVNPNNNDPFCFAKSAATTCDYDVFVDSGALYEMRFINNNKGKSYIAFIFCDGICVNDPSLTIETFDIDRHMEALVLLPVKPIDTPIDPVIVNGFRDKNNEVKQFAFSSTNRESFANKQGYEGRKGHIDIVLYILDADKQKYSDAYNELSRLRTRYHQLKRQIEEDDREASSRPPMMHMITTTGSSARDLQERIAGEFLKQLNKLQQTAFNDNCYELISEKKISIFLKSR